MSSFETCATDFGNWLPALITFSIVFIILEILSQFDNKVLYISLLPARVIILGILWSESPGKDSIQLDMSFNEVSVSVTFILLVKNIVESYYGNSGFFKDVNKINIFEKRPFLCFDEVSYFHLVIFCSILSLAPALSGIIAELTNQYAMGLLSTTVVVILLTQQHQETRPTEKVNLTHLKIFFLALVISSLTLFSSFADCFGGEGWVGLICAYPIDSVIILYQTLYPDKNETLKLQSNTVKKEHFRQVVYLISLSCYIHYTMTSIIWISSKLEFLKNIRDYESEYAILAFVIITIISGLIVFFVVDNMAFLGRVKRIGNNIISVFVGDNKSDGTTEEALSFLTTKSERSNNLYHKYEMGSIRL